MEVLRFVRFVTDDEIIVELVEIRNVLHSDSVCESWGRLVWSLNNGEIGRERTGGENDGERVLSCNSFGSLETSETQTSSSNLGSLFGVSVVRENGNVRSEAVCRRESVKEYEARQKEDSPFELGIPVSKNGFGENDQCGTIGLGVSRPVDVLVDESDEGDSLKSLSGSHFVGELGIERIRKIRFEVRERSRRVTHDSTEESVEVTFDDPIHTVKLVSFECSSRDESGLREYRRRSDSSSFLCLLLLVRLRPGRAPGFTFLAISVCDGLLIFLLLGGFLSPCNHHLRFL